MFVRAIEVTVATVEVEHDVDDVEYDMMLGCFHYCSGLVASASHGLGPTQAATGEQECKKTWCSTS